MKRIMAILLVVIITLSLFSGCGNNKENHQKASVVDDITEVKEDSVSIQSNYDYNEANIVSVSTELIDSNTSSDLGLFIAYLTLQNSSDSKTVSNLKINYYIVDDILNEISKLTETIPISLSPRKKAYLKYTGFSKSSDRFGVTTYSYVSDGFEYTVDLQNKVANCEKSTLVGTKNFSSKNVVSISSSEIDKFKITNNASFEISHLTVNVAKFDENSNYIGTEQKEVISKDENLQPGKSKEFFIDNDYESFNHFGFDSKITKVTSYSYKGAVDENGNNFFTIDLINKTSMDSQEDIFEIKNHKQLSTEEVDKEITKYTSYIGKESSKCDFDFVQTKMASYTTTVSEDLYLAESEKFLNLDGELHFIRDYDSLEIMGFGYCTFNGDENIETYLMDCLTKKYGVKYDESKQEYGNQYTWKMKDLTVLYVHGIAPKKDWVSITKTGFKEEGYIGDKNK